MHPSHRRLLTQHTWQHTVEYNPASTLKGYGVLIKGHSRLWSYPPMYENGENDGKTQFLARLKLRCTTRIQELLLVLFFN